MRTPLGRETMIRWWKRVHEIPPWSWASDPYLMGMRAAQFHILRNCKTEEEAVLKLEAEMESKTARAMDQACLKVEREFERFMKAIHAAREAIKAHYAATKPESK